MTTSKIRLGPLPNQETTRITIPLSTVLREELDNYARIYAQTFGQTIDLTALIPHMLLAFIARDRGFQRMRAAEKHSKSSSF